MPFRNLAVGAWSYDTFGRSFGTRHTRMWRLKDAVAALANFRDEQVQAAATQKDKGLWTNPTGRPSMVFVAPEYMFMAPCQSGLSKLDDERFLDTTARDRILAELQEVSEDYGTQLVFAPGSIAFKMPFLKGNDCAEEIAARHAKALARLEEGAARIQASYAAHGIDLPHGRDQPLSGNFRGRTARTTQSKIDQLSKAATNHYRDTFLGVNKMYLLHRGKVIGTYRKRCDFHEVLPGYTGRTIFIPGHKPGRATVAGVPFGLEICLDHGSGVLAGTSSVTGTLPSVQLVCSAAVELKPDNVVLREGGYLVHASSNENWSGVWRKQAGAFDDVATEEVDVGDGTLMCGVMELNIP
jgi:predicted amidohydrolase